jgi:hypothetical protein
MYLYINIQENTSRILYIFCNRVKYMYIWEANNIHAEQIRVIYLTTVFYHKVVCLELLIYYKSSFLGARNTVPMFHKQNKRPNNAWRWMWAKMQLWIIFHTLGVCGLKIKKGIKHINYQHLVRRFFFEKRERVCKIKFILGFT